MAKDFVMGARITLTDDFSNPIRDVMRATDDFRRMTEQADDSASQLTRELVEMNQTHRATTRATDQTADAVREAHRSIEQLDHAAQSSSNSMREASNTMNSWGSRLGSIKTNVLGVTAAVAGLAGSFAALQAADGMLGRIQAMTGATGAEAAKLTEAAKNVYADGWGDSLHQTAVDMGIVKQQLSGLSTAASEEFLKSSYILQDAFGAEVTDVTKTVGNLVRQFGDLSETEALDMITKGFQSGADISGDFLDTLNEYSVQFKGLGFSSEQAFGTLIAGSKSGAFMLDKVGDAVKESFIRMQDFSKTSLDAFKAIGLDGMKMSKKIAAGGDEANQAYQQTLIALAALDEGAREAHGIALFGTQWEDVGDSIIPTIQAGMKGLDGFEGATAAAGEALKANLGDQAQITARNMLVAFTTAGQPITDVMTGAFMFINKHMDSVQTAAKVTARGISMVFEALATTAHFVINNWALIGPLIEGVGAAWLIYGGYLLFVKAQTIALAAVQAAYTGALWAYRTAVLAVNIAMMAMRGQFTLLWMTMLFSPIGMIVTALGLLAAAGILVARNWGAIRGAFIRAFDFMAPYLATTKQAFVTFGQQAYGAIVQTFDWIAAKFNAAKEWGAGIKEGLGPIGDVISNSFSGIGNTLASISPLIARLGLSFLGVSGPVGWVIAGIITLGSWLFKLINNNDSLKASFMDAWASVSAVFTSVLGPAVQQFAKAFEQLVPQFAETGRIIAEAFIALGPSFTQLGLALVELGTTIGTLVVQLITGLAPIVLQIATTVLPMLVSAFTALVPAVLRIATTVIPLILNAVQRVFPLVLQIVQTVLPVIIQIIMTLVPIILQIAQVVIPMILQAVQLVFPLIQGIITAVLPVITGALQMAAAIITGVLVPAIEIILAAVDIVFPAIMTVIQSAMAIVTGIIQTAAALLQGDWAGAWNAIKSTSETIMQNIISFFESINLFETGKHIIQGLIDGIAGMAKAAGDAVKGVAKGIKDAVTGFFDIHSPSRVFRTEVGQQLGAGLMLGMADSEKGLIKAATSMATAATPDLNGMKTAALVPALASQLEVATNMNIPTVPELYTTLNVGTEFDDGQTPTYATATEVSAVNPAGAGRAENSGSRSVIIQKLIEKLEIKADKDVDVESLVDQLLAILQERLEAADEILGSDRGVLL